MYLYVSICIYMYLYVSICIYMYLYVSICIYMYLYVSILSICIYMYLYVSICIYMYLYVSICIYMYLYVSICIYMYICIFVYMYICIYVSIYVNMYIIYVYMFFCCAGMLEDETWHPFERSCIGTEEETLYGAPTLSRQLQDLPLHSSANDVLSTVKQHVGPTNLKSLKKATLPMLHQQDGRPCTHPMHKWKVAFARRGFSWMSSGKTPCRNFASIRSIWVQPIFRPLQIRKKHSGEWRKEKRWDKMGSCLNCVMLALLFEPNTISVPWWSWLCKNPFTTKEVFSFQPRKAKDLPLIPRHTDPSSLARTWGRSCIGLSANIKPQCTNSTFVPSTKTSPGQPRTAWSEVLFAMWAEAGSAGWTPHGRSYWGILPRAQATCSGRSLRGRSDSPFRAEAAYGWISNAGLAQPFGWPQCTWASAFAGPSTKNSQGIAYRHILPNSRTRGLLSSIRRLPPRGQLCRCYIQLLILACLEIVSKKAPRFGLARDCATWMCSQTIFATPTWSEL